MGNYMGASGKLTTSSGGEKDTKKREEPVSSASSQNNIAPKSSKDEEKEEGSRFVLLPCYNPPSAGREPSKDAKMNEGESNNNQTQLNKRKTNRSWEQIVSVLSNPIPDPSALTYGNQD